MKFKGLPNACGDGKRINTVPGRYRDFVARYNNIMTELAKDPDSPVTSASVLPA